MSFLFSHENVSFILIRFIVCRKMRKNEFNFSKIKKQLLNVASFLFLCRFGLWDKKEMRLHNYESGDKANVKSFKWYFAIKLCFNFERLARARLERKLNSLLVIIFYVKRKGLTTSSLTPEAQKNTKGLEWTA